MPVSDYWDREAEISMGETFVDRCKRLEARNRKLEEAVEKHAAFFAYLKNSTRVTMDGITLAMIARHIKKVEELLNG